MTLLELAERCEAATGPSGFLDRHIAAALGLLTENALGQPVFIGKGKSGSLSVPRYTASLDAAMTLVPDGWMTDATERNVGSLNDTGRDWVVRMFDQPGTCNTVVARHKSFALALCAAALRARGQA